MFTRQAMRAPQAMAAPDARIAPEATLAPTRTGPPQAGRRGISLIEVLISMFVLLFGLMGVAAIFPVGNHFAAQGDRSDRASVLADEAFAEIRARGMLRPELWVWPLIGAANPSPMPFINALPDLRNNRQAGEFSVWFNDPLASPGYAFVLDPRGAALGAYDLRTDVDLFPIATVETDPNGSLPLGGRDLWRSVDATRWPVRRLTFASPAPLTGVDATRIMPVQLVDSIFRLRDDLAVALPEESDRPGIQRFDASSASQALARGTVGDYTWFATLVPPSRAAWQALQPAHPEHGNFEYDVSVAVVHKREALPPALANERMIAGRMLPGGELILHARNSSDAELSVDNAVRDVREGHWIAVVGIDYLSEQQRPEHARHARFQFKWYRVLSMDNETVEILEASGNSYFGRRLMLDGPEWRASPDVRAIFVPGVVQVVTRSMKLSPRPAQ